MKRLLAAVALLFPVACTDANAARGAAEAYGFSNIETTGYQAWGCSDDDTVHTGFTATNVRGQRVRGIVCSEVGPFGKAPTVRITGVESAPTGVPMVSQ